jgi:hypothetical protein
MMVARGPASGYICDGLRHSHSELRNPIAAGLSVRIQQPSPKIDVTSLTSHKGAAGAASSGNFLGRFAPVSFIEAEAAAFT